MLTIITLIFIILLIIIIIIITAPARQHSPPLAARVPEQQPAQSGEAPRQAGVTLGCSCCL